LCYGITNNINLLIDWLIVWFNSLAESNQKTLKVGIYSFSGWCSALKE